MINFCRHFVFATRLQNILIFIRKFQRKFFSKLPFISKICQNRNNCGDRIKYQIFKAKCNKILRIASNCVERRKIAKTKTKLDPSGDQFKVSKGQKCRQVQMFKINFSKLPADKFRRINSGGFRCSSSGSDVQNQVQMFFFLRYQIFASFKQNPDKDKRFLKISKRFFFYSDEKFWHKFRPNAHKFSGGSDCCQKFFSSGKQEFFFVGAAEKYKRHVTN